MHDAKFTYVLCEGFKCWEELYEHSGNKDNIIIPLLTKVGVNHQVVDTVMAI